VPGFLRRNYECGLKQIIERINAESQRVKPHFSKGEGILRIVLKKVYRQINPVMYLQDKTDARTWARVLSPLQGEMPEAEYPRFLVIANLI
jgi:hypothetical protein